MILNGNSMKITLEAISINSHYITIKSALIGVLWACVVIAVLIDLYHGIRKSKMRGEFTNSYGIRKTVEKASGYLTFMLFMLIGDTVASIATSSLLPFGIAVLPVFNILGATILVRNEWISVREKADQKMMKRINKSGAEIGRVLLEAMVIFKNNPEVLEEIIKRYEENKKPNDEAS